MTDVVNTWETGTKVWYKLELSSMSRIIGRIRGPEVIFPNGKKWFRTDSVFFNHNHEAL